MQSGECVLLEQPVEDVAVSNVLVVAEPDGIQGELCDVEETSICEIPGRTAHCHLLSVAMHFGIPRKTTAAS